MQPDKPLILLEGGYGGCSACGYVGDFDALMNAAYEVTQWRCSNCRTELSKGAGIDKREPGAAREINKLRLMFGDERTDWPLSLVCADDPVMIEQLQAITGMSQIEAVDYLIETYGMYDLLDWMGGVGTPAERLHALRALRDRYLSGEQ
jgi:hypothetical protein